MLRFVIDESSWNLAEAGETEIEVAVEGLLERLKTAKERSEEACVYDGFYDFDGVTPPPFEALFQRSSPIVDRDLRTRLSRAIDRLATWQDEPALEVVVDGQQRLGPSIAFAHDRVGRHEAIACLPLLGCAGPTDVAVGGETRTVHFVTNEAQHRSFMRDAVEVERCGMADYARLAPSAFPDLAWADDVWAGLGEFSQPFHDMRTRLTTHLTALDDYGAAIFEDLPPQQWSGALSSRGAPATDENGKAKQDKKARSARTKSWQRVDHVFWWHTKLQPHVDRIHFLYDTASKRIVIGIFKDHCFLP